MTTAVVPMAEGEENASAIDRPDILMNVLLIASQGDVAGVRRKTRDHAIEQEWDHQNEEWARGCDVRRRNPDDDDSAR